MMRMNNANDQLGAVFLMRDAIRNPRLLGSAAGTQLATANSAAVARSTIPQALTRVMKADIASDFRPRLYRATACAEAIAFILPRKYSQLSETIAVQLRCALPRTRALHAPAILIQRLPQAECVGVLQLTHFPMMTGLRALSMLLVCVPPW